MVSTLLELVNVILRWLHIASAAVLVGGLIYARVVVIPAIRALPEESRSAWRPAAGAGFRPLVLAGFAGLVVSGLFSFLTAPGHTLRYDLLLALKLLLAAHVITVAFILTGPDARPEREARRPRMLAGAALSGLAAILIAAYLRRIF
jgi:uncharacterized membrane protein